VSRITHGVIRLELEPVSVAAIVARAVEAARPTIDARRHELTLDLPDELIYVNGDRTRLAQVFSNLLHNAAKFMDPGGRMSLRATADDSHVEITVSDNGAGIPLDMLPRLFGLFTQIHAKSDRSKGGLGVGLALVQRLTEMHGGTVRAHSDGPGRGAVFTVRLPTLSAQTAPNASHPKTHAVPAVPPQRILVADDNQDAAECLSLQLQLAGHEVRTVNDGLEAVSVGNSFEPHVVLLDLGMPRMDGYEAARQIRGEPWGKRATLVALTGWGQQQDRQRTAAAGFDVHLVKPVVELELRRVLASAGLQRRGGAAAQRL
jgi:CheY-like chemotaxis protein